MSQRDHLFQIIVRCSNHAQIGHERILGRDTVAAAVDAAQRELRRQRNTARGGHNFDTWDLYDMDRGRRNRTLIATGGIDGQVKAVPSRDSGSDSPGY